METGIGSFIFFGCTGVMGWVLLFNRAGKYDESDGAPIEGNTKLEIIWTIIPSGDGLRDRGTYTMNVNMKLQNLGPKHKYAIGTDPTALMEADPIADVGPIDVIARQWSWEFVYPNAACAAQNCIMPVDQRVNFRLDLGRRSAQFLSFRPSASNKTSSPEASFPTASRQPKKGEVPVCATPCSAVPISRRTRPTSSSNPTRPTAIG